MSASTYSHSADYRPLSRSGLLDWRVMAVEGVHIFHPSPSVIRVVAQDFGRLVRAGMALRLAGCRRTDNPILYEDE